VGWDRPSAGNGQKPEESWDKKVDKFPWEQPDPQSPPVKKTERRILMDGERELTTGMLAKDASFRLIVSGKIGVKEIERLIQKLEIDKEILADQDDQNEEAAN
jgi:hypothetical protein